METNQIFSLLKLKYSLAILTIGISLFSVNSTTIEASELQEPPSITQESPAITIEELVETEAVEKDLAEDDLVIEETALPQESPLQEKSEELIIEEIPQAHPEVPLQELTVAEEASVNEASLLQEKEAVVDVAINQASVEEASPTLVRHQGDNREEVAINVAKEHFSDANKVIIVNQELDKFPDAISATNISQGNYPVLYTRANNINNRTIDFMKSMAQLNEIYLLGGKTSISEPVESLLKNEFGNRVTRIDGRTRFDANSNAIRENYSQTNHVVIATGEIYTDALYGVSYANIIKAPIILSKTNRLEAASLDLLKELGTSQATIIGGINSVTEDVDRQLTSLGIQVQPRIAGQNRYDGSSKVASQSYKNPETILIASGDVFTDALVSAPLAQKLNAPILLVRKDSMVTDVQDYLKNNASSIQTIYIQGGPNTVSVANEVAIKRAATPGLTTKQVSTVMTVPFETKIQYTNQLFKDESRILRKGDNGERTIVTEITYLNGIESSQKEVSNTITLNPVTQIVEQGTKNRRIDLILETPAAEAYNLAKGINFDYINYQEMTPAESQALANHMNLALLNQEFEKILNNHRASLGLNPVTYEPRYASNSQLIADEYAAYGGIRVEGYEPHTRPNGQPTLTAHGDHPGFAAWGENLVQIYTNGNPYKVVSEKYLAEYFFELWENSPGHKAVMENPIYKGYSLSVQLAHAGVYGQTAIGVLTMTK